MDKLDKAEIKLPKLEFKKECPLCHQMWLTFPADICPDCIEAKKTFKVGKPQVVEVKKNMDPVVGENDAIEEWWQK